MRKTNWLFLLMLGSVGLTLASGVALVQLLLHPPLPPVELPPHADAATYASIAIDLAGQQRYADAISVNTRALSYAPDQAALLYNQGWMAAHLGRWMQALIFLDKARARAPRDPQTLYLRAWVLQQLGRGPEALAAQREADALGWKPSDPYARARVLQLQNQHAEALRAFDQALAARPDQRAPFWYWRSRSDLALHKSKEALADLDKAIAIRADAALYSERASLHQALGQPDKAFADLSAAQRLAPSRETRLAQIQLQLELDPVAGQAAAADLLKTQPDWPPAQLLQVRVQLAARQTKPAQKALDAYLKAHPGDADALGLQAVIYRNQRRYPEALKALEQARSAGYAPALLELEQARIAVQQGQKPEAKAHLVKALQLQPSLRDQLQSDRVLKKIAKDL